jgi:hypothetical protein
MLTEEIKVIYRGMRDGTITEVRVNRKPLCPRHDLHHYSDKFNWGGAGHDDNQLALAILADALDDTAAKEAHEDFKFDVLSRLVQDEWTVDRESIQHWFSDWSKINSACSQIR